MVLYDILFSVLRSILAFTLTILMTRFMGRKAISQMTFFDFVVSITIGAVTAIIAISSASSVYSSVTALITLSILTVVTDYFHLKSIKFSKLVTAEPVILIANGKINDQNMRKTRFTIEDLTRLLRDKDVFDINDVEFAIVENDGKLSVLPKSQKQPLTPSDVKIPTSYKGLTKDLIIDGKIMLENLEDIHLNEDWLKNQLNAKGIVSIHDVFYAGIDTSGSLYISIRSTGNEKHGKYGIE